VKRVYLRTDLEDQVHYEVKLNFSTAGPKLGKRTGLVQKQLQQLSDEAIVEMVKGNCDLTLPSGESLLLDEEDLIVKQVTKAGVEMAANQSYTVLLDMVITKELEQEGLARELIRAVQLYRKELHLPVDKRVCITFDVSDPIKDVIKQFQDLLTTNLLISDLKFGETAVMKTVEIDGESIRLGID
jgi:isoleucyl-tRNA synthetase